MLYPQNNTCRRVTDLSGFWTLKPDPDDIGEKSAWNRGFAEGLIVGVPGSWNEQLAEAGLMNYVGKVWYQKNFFAPAVTGQERMILRFGAADFNARVWINGQYLGEHKGGFLPFEFDVTGIVTADKENKLIVCNDNMLDHDSIPQGLAEQDFLEFGKVRELTYPPTVFDFFAYGGLSRPVCLYTRPVTGLEQLKIVTRIKGGSGLLDVTAVCSEHPVQGELRLTLREQEQIILSTHTGMDTAQVRVVLEIPDCKFWSPEDPALYTLQLALYQKNELMDEYYLETGIREVTIDGDRLLLNGKPVFLKGFGKHEDFAVLGRGLSYPLIVKDFQLLKWIGANSFRTSHYPYAEEVLQLADRLGFLVIDEAPAVSLNFRYVSNRTLDQHKQLLTEMIRRDQNHPCVIAWSVANEPGIWGEPEAVAGQARQYWQEIFSHTKKLDPARPVTLPACAKWQFDDPVYALSDFISVNRYWGWYEIPGEPGRAGTFLRKELETLHKKYHKPVMLTEFGADTQEGAHATYPQMFTEEYQSALLQVYFETIAALPFMIGEHIWNFADFLTAQNHRRFIMNKKGVFTRQREPKSAAFAIRRYWSAG